MYNLLRMARAEAQDSSPCDNAASKPEGLIAFEGNVTAVKASEQSRLIMAADKDLYELFQPCFRAIFLQELSATL